MWLQQSHCFIVNFFVKLLTHWAAITAMWLICVWKFLEVKSAYGPSDLLGRSLWIFLLPPPPDEMLVHYKVTPQHEFHQHPFIHLGVEMHCVSLCLAQEHNTVLQA